MRTLRLVALGIAACVAAGVAARGETALRDKGVELPLTQFHQAAVDPVTGRVFVVGSAWVKENPAPRGLPNAGLVVLSPDGGLMSVNRRLQSASGVTVRPGTRAAFVALLKDNAIVQVDTQTLEVVRRFPLPAAAGCPDLLAWASGRVWFTINCGNTNGIASLDPATGVVSVATLHAARAAHPTLTAGGRYVVAADTETSGGVLAVYRITGDRLVRAASMPIDYARDLALTRDGRLLFAAGRSAGERTLPHLGQGTVYSVPLAMGAIATSPDGRVVLAASSATGSTILAFHRGNPKPFWKRSISPYDGIPAYAGIVHSRTPGTVLVFDAVSGTQHPFVKVFHYSSPGGAKR